MDLYGLIGFPLSHSFSRKYFSEKFSRENIQNADYRLFEIPEIGQLVDLLRSSPELKGLNVTIPYKQQVYPYLHDLDNSAEKVGAVNVIRIRNGRLTGFNSDYYGFRESLENWEGFLADKGKALVLGTGGAAKAVFAVLSDLKIDYQVVSRDASKGDLVYSQLDHRLLEQVSLIVNTTPLGMSPAVNTAPELPYELLNKNHFLYDLVYNPPVTLFMQKGSENECRVKNGLEMLELQAEKSWEIWNSP
jgi:shikimate dehydrogenase